MRLCIYYSISKSFRLIIIHTNYMKCQSLCTSCTNSRKSSQLFNKPADLSAVYVH